MEGVWSGGETRLLPLISRASDWEFLSWRGICPKDWAKSPLVVSGGSGEADGDVREAGLKALGVTQGVVTWESSGELAEGETSRTDHQCVFRGKGKEGVQDYPRSIILAISS